MEKLKKLSGGNKYIMINESKVQLRYEEALLKTKILDVAAQLDTDGQYKRETAVEELGRIVDWLEGKG